MEGADGLVLLDARAASERIIFETMRREAAAGQAVNSFITGLAQTRLDLPKLS
jgi:DNA mismatch repair ATPase MutL